MHHSNNCDTHLQWKEELKSVMVNAFGRLETLNETEQDCIFAIQPGSDFTRLSVGNFATTSQKQLIIVLGFSDVDITGDLNADTLSKTHLSYQQQTEKQNLLGLFYDPSQKDKQEIMFVPPHDVKPLSDLDYEMKKASAKNSALLDP